MSTIIRLKIGVVILLLGMSVPAFAGTRGTLDECLSQCHDAACQSCCGKKVPADAKDRCFEKCRDGFESCMRLKNDTEDCDRNCQVDCLRTAEIQYDCHDANPVVRQI